MCLLSIFNSRPFFCFSPPLRLAAGGLLGPLSHWSATPLRVCFPWERDQCSWRGGLHLLRLLLSLRFSPFITCPRTHSRSAQVWAPKMQSSELPLRSGWAGPYPVLVQRPTEKGFAAVLPPGISKPWRLSFCFFASPSEKRVGS